MKRFVLLMAAAVLMSACGGDGSGDDYAARLRGETGSPAPTSAASFAAQPTPMPQPTSPPAPTPAPIPTTAPQVVLVAPTPMPAPTLLPTTTPYVPPPAPAPVAAPVGACHYEWRGNVRVTIFCPEGVQP